MNQFAGYFSIEAKVKAQGFDVNRHELVATYSNGKYTSLKQLGDAEYRAFLNWISLKFNLTHATKWQDSPTNIMRRKVWSLFVRKMHYTQEGLDSWMLKYSIFKKPLNAYTHEELVRLVTQVEAVYKSYLTELDKK